jgi:hypothetical protein
LRNSRVFLLLVLIAVFLAGVYLILSAQAYRVGFPLDDAWIHQTFARNLAQYGEWSFNPGQPAAGSTSPFWTILLSVGYLLGIPKLIWAFGLGVILLSLVGWTVYAWFSRSLSSRLSFGLAVLVMSEWHLVWAALSGMETLLQALFLRRVLRAFLKEKPRWIWIGVVCGLSIWTRPDGISLLGPILVGIGYAIRNRTNIRQAIISVCVISVLGGGFLAFNAAIAGTVWPNTFYAKQMEYQELLSVPLINRFIGMWLAPLAGVGMVLLPGFLWGMFRDLQKREIMRIAIYLWILGYVLLYAWRLPVTYQHGRYLLPMMPVFLVLSLTGVLGIDMKRWAANLRFIASRTYGIVVCLTAVLFLFLGARAYATDVAIIEQEMVDSAIWIEQNTPSDSIVAVHDIGAVGYYSERFIVDLAGLIDPSVIPDIRNPERLADYIVRKNARYLMIFPGWYQPVLPLSLMEVYRSDGNYSRQAGGENMVVYRIE